MTGNEAEQQSEAKELEQAETRCAAEGKHAVTRRADNQTLYDCVGSGEAPSNSGNLSQP